jgi:hypothetical protein
MDLIYFTIGHKREYETLARLCVASLVATGYAGDLLFIADDDFAPDRALPGGHANRVDVMRADARDMFHSSANKLRICEWDRVAEYDRFVYCDLDVLWLKHPRHVFDLLAEDKVFMTRETGLMTETYFSEGLLEPGEAEAIARDKIRGLNGGFMGFNRNMLPVVAEMLRMLRTSGKRPACLEQPFMNVTLLRDGRYDGDALTAISANIHDYERPDVQERSVFIHFAGGPGNWKDKLNRMTKYNEEHN